MFLTYLRSCAYVLALTHLLSLLNCREQANPDFKGPCFGVRKFGKSEGNTPSKTNSATFEATDGEGSKKALGLPAASASVPVEQAREVGAVSTPASVNLAGLTLEESNTNGQHLSQPPAADEPPPAAAETNGVPPAAVETNGVPTESWALDPFSATAAKEEVVSETVTPLAPPPEPDVASAADPALPGRRPWRSPHPHKPPQLGRPPAHTEAAAELSAQTGECGEGCYLAVSENNQGTLALLWSRGHPEETGVLAEGQVKRKKAWPHKATFLEWKLSQKACKHTSPFYRCCSRL